jgi:multidrug efflux system outer membrane protein
MTLARRTTLLAGLPLLGGCAWLRPPSSSAGIATPDRFANAGALPPAWPDPHWWRGFGAPELDALMEAAMADNLDMAAAAARIRQADAQVRIAGAALLPTVDLQGGGSRSQSAGGPKRDQLNLSLGASYEVDFWGRNRSQVEAARQTARATAYDAVTIRLTTQASVAQTWLSMLASQQQLEIQNSNLALAERILGITQQREAVGTGTGLDTAQQRTLVAQQRAQVPPLRQTIAQNRNALAILTGRLPGSITLPGGVFNQLQVPPAAPGQPGELLSRRPDVRAAEANLASANADIAAARAALLPSLSLDVSGGFAAGTLAQLVRPESALYSLAASLFQPIFSGGALRGAESLTQARAQELVATYRLAILTALGDVEDALIALRETTEQEQLRREAVDAAEAANAIAEAQFRAGTIDLITQLNTQQSLFQARNSLTTARLDRLNAAVALFRALGGGWQP